MRLIDWWLLAASSLSAFFGGGLLHLRRVMACVRLRGNARPRNASNPSRVFWWIPGGALGRMRKRKTASQFLFV